jgi:hypothetical protein
MISRKGPTEKLSQAKRLTSPSDFGLIFHDMEILGWIGTRIRATPYSTFKGSTTGGEGLPYPIVILLKGPILRDAK